MFTHRPLPIRFINAVGRRFLKKAPTLDPAELMEKALKESGIAQYDDTSFFPALEQLADSLEQDARLNLIGRFVMNQFCTGILTNRLNIQETLKQQPAILERPVIKPLFIIGLAR